METKKGKGKLKIEEMKLYLDLKESHHPSARFYWWRKQAHVVTMKDGGLWDVPSIVAAPSYFF